MPQAISGIYLITCLPVNQRPYYYVGQTSDFYRRRREHKHELKKGKHCNTFLQRVVDAHGLCNTKIELLEKCHPDELNTSEQWWLDEMFGYKNVVNAVPHATSNRGYRKSPESCAAQSARQKGINNPCYGRVASAEERELRSLMMRGVGNPFYGKTHSADYKTKRQLNNSSARPEVRAKISATLTGRKPSSEVREKLKTCHPTKEVESVSPDGAVVYFRSLGDVERAGFHKTHVAECCSGKRKTHGGLTWRWANADKPKA